MVRNKISLFIVYLLLNTSFANAQLGQVTSIVSIAAKYATLLKSNQNNVIYSNENFDEIVQNHSKIAIIPFNSLITYEVSKDLSVEEAEQQYENQQMIGKMLQEQFWDVFDNYPSEVDLQDIRITNKVLNDIDYFTKKDQFPPSYLAKLLEVDAVLICTYDIHIDNQKTGWQNLSKAFTDLAMTQLKGTVPGLGALKFVKNPSAIINIATKPGEFFKKLKSGDISSLVDIAGTMLPEGNWKKIAEIAANNSKSIVKVASGDTSNLFSDLISNNANLLSSELKLSPQVVKLVQNNSKVVQNVIAGNTQGLMFDLISNNLQSVTGKYISDKNNILNNAINNNSSIIAKLASGDTSNLLEDVFHKNIGQVANLVGDEKSSFYSDLLLKNKDIVSKVIKGDVTNLTADLLANNANLLGGAISNAEANKYIQLLANKDAIQGILSGDKDAIINTLTNEGLQLLGEEFNNVDIAKFSNLLSENRNLVKGLIDGDKQQIFSSLLENNSGLLGAELNNDQIQKLVKIVHENGDLIQTVIEGTPDQAFGMWLNNLNDQVKYKDLSKVSNLLLNNKESLSTVLKGNKNEIISLLGNSNIEDAESIATLFIENKAKINELVGLAPDVDLSILGKSKEDLEIMAYKITSNSDILGGIVSGNSDRIINTLSTNSDIDLEDQKLITELSTNLVSEQKNISTLIINSEVNKMLLSNKIDLQFFDFGEDALLEDYENVSLRKKTFSQTAASILDPTTDPKDYTKITINIFGKESNDLLWQYINVNSKTRIYDMSKTLPEVVKRLNKKFPYYIK